LGPDFLLLSLGLRKHIEVLEREKATLKQQAEESQKKLEAAKERWAAIEENLTEGAVTAVEHVVGVIKSRQPDFEPNLILQGYNCSQADDVQQLLDGIRPTAVAFVEKLGSSVDDDDDEDGK
jgi:ornithine cyclodeaminase/alanine dehydrogenase-like protein (mu-crystallin family)